MAHMSKNFTRVPTMFPLEIVRNITDRLFVDKDKVNPRRVLLDVIYSIAPNSEELRAWYVAPRETMYCHVELRDVVGEEIGRKFLLDIAAASTEVELKFKPWKKVQSLTISYVDMFLCVFHPC